jgi:hypothetical protein
MKMFFAKSASTIWALVRVIDCSLIMRLIRQTGTYRPDCRRSCANSGATRGLHMIAHDPYAPQSATLGTEVTKTDKYPKRIT